MDYSFDRFGNLYISSNGSTVQIEIDRNNHPIASHGEFPIIPSDALPPSVLKFQQKENPNSQMLDDNGLLMEQMEEDTYDILNSPEEESNDSGNSFDEFYGQLNQEFIFCSDEISFPINNRQHGQVCALYETYIYTDDSKLIFISKSSLDILPYRIKLNISTQSLTLHIIGTSEIEYKIVYNDDSKQIIIAQ